MWRLGLVSLVLLVAQRMVEGQLVLSFGTPPTQASAGGIDPNCADKLDNCEMFGQESCGGQYEQWARDNCALTCKYCVGPPTTPPPCVDLLPNCEAYEGGACSDPQYQSWAKANCRRTCRMCPADVLARLDAQTTTIPPSQCVDKLDCRLYGQQSCSGDYEKWARENCMNYCGFCVGAPTTAKPCLDSRPNCNQYEKDMCNNPDYSIWVDDNCPQYCGRCGSQGNSYNSPPPIQPGKRQAPDNQVPPTPEIREDCADTIDNCREFGEAGCRGIYEAWAKVRCSKYCGFCINPKATEAPCVDANAFCDRYGADACTNPSYKFWAEDNCRKTCNLCNGPITATDSPDGPVGTSAAVNTPMTPPAPVVTSGIIVEQTTAPTFAPATPSPPGSGPNSNQMGGSALGSVTTIVIEGPAPKEPGKCLYQGKSYSENETWVDGCNYDCTCMNAAKNRMVCVEKCNRWVPGVEAVTGCRLVTSPGECCPKLAC